MSTDAFAAAAAGGERRTPSAISIVIVTLMVIATLRLGRVVVLPVVIAVLLTLTLGAPVRWLMARRIPRRFAAALVVFDALGVGLATATRLFTPATELVASAPATLQKLEVKIRRLARPFTALQLSADRMQDATSPSTAGAPRSSRRRASWHSCPSTPWRRSRSRSP